MAQAKRKRRRRQRKQRRHADRASGTAERPAAQSQKPRARARRRDRRGAPPAPWGSFPLAELVIAIAIVLFILGAAVASGQRQVALVLVALGLASLAGLELAVREHFAGYRSHTTLLAALPAAITLGTMFALVESLSILVRLVAASAVFAAAALLLVRAFRARSGGYSFRISARGP